MDAVAPTLRRGLPRVAGGEPWPPGDAVATGVFVEPLAPDAVDPSSVTETLPAAAVASVVEEQHPAAAETAPAVPSAARLRRGLPREAGGEPWPPAALTPQITDALSAQVVSAPAASAPVASAPGVSAPVASSEVLGATEATATTAASSGAAAAIVSRGVTLRRGLPRVAGGEAWPPAGISAQVAGTVLPHEASESTVGAHAAHVERAASISSGADVSVGAMRDVSTPLVRTPTAWNGVAPRRIAVASASARRRPTWTQAIAALMGAAALGVLAGSAVAFVRALLSLPFMQDFLGAFPGEYQPAITVEPGFAPWIGWQHFFNMFLMVLIIRSGLGVRTEKRPTVFWTPRGKGKGKISLTLWLHQSLDLLWIINGVIFVVLLFVTGHWVRIVPTSWEVFPNALSAGLQYISFDWPHENGWNNYNSLQQLAYFFTVFIAAPLAVVTGIRMSGLWPQKAEKLSKAYPVEWARALHFPIMLYFVVFIIGHVALVMLTGFLANLNHMFAAQQAAGWTGFWVFIAALAVIAVAWGAARPLVLAPIAKLFGQVSGR